MPVKRLLLLVALLLLIPTAAPAVSCIGVGNVTLLGPAGCNLGGLTFSNYTVSASAGFSSAVVGLGSASTADPNKVNLVYQLTTPGIGPGDVLLSYGVTAGPGVKLTGINLTNDAILDPVAIGEIACRVPFSLGSTCAPADRLATIVALPGHTAEATFLSPVDFMFLHKDIAVGVGGFISDFSNSHELQPVPEPVTLMLLGGTLVGVGVAARKKISRWRNPAATQTP